MKLLSLLLLSAVLLAGIGCKRKGPEISDLQRKEAANLVSEADFALTLRDFARAEPLLERATKLAPDTGEYWVSLGIARRRQGNSSGAKAAYQGALDAYREAYDADEKRTAAMIQEVYVLALLGRADDARKALDRARERAPEDRGIRQFIDEGQLDRLLQDPAFKDISL